VAILGVDSVRGVPANVTDQLVPEGSPVSTKVMRYVAGGVAVKVAVIVPLAEIVTVVEEEEREMTLPAVLLHEVNVSPVHAAASSA